MEVVKENRSLEPKMRTNQTLEVADLSVVVVLFVVVELVVFVVVVQLVVFVVALFVAELVALRVVFGVQIVVFVVVVAV